MGSRATGPSKEVGGQGGGPAEGSHNAQRELGSVVLPFLFLLSPSERGLGMLVYLVLNSARADSFVVCGAS